MCGRLSETRRGGVSDARLRDRERQYIVFLPTAADIGVQELEARVEGDEKPIYTKGVEVKVKRTRSPVMKKIS